jgi:ribosomal protein S12 methylthiotransferase accessory factor
MLDLARAPQPKVAGSFDRCVPLETSLALIPRLRDKYAITRVGNVTGLDRIGIPTFCAIVPASLAQVGVYNGKGATDDAARVSAVFEAAERQAAAAPALAVRRERDGTESVEGIDLLANAASVPVPLARVQHPWFGNHDPRFPASTSNGLAAGNTLTEAVYHALCESIERHAWSICHVRCTLLPRILQGATADADFGFASELRVPTGDPAVDALAARVVSAGLHLRVMLLSQAEAWLPPVMLASIVEDRSDPPMSHVGLGCSLSPAHAAVRAIAEAAQSRLTDIQGAREDAARLRTLPKNAWFYDVPAPLVALGTIADESSDDLARDVGCLLSKLERSGASRVTVVDVSPADVAGLHVVRAIVPELETTCVDGRIGPKARAALNPFFTSAVY